MLRSDHKVWGFGSVPGEGEAPRAAPGTMSLLPGEAERKKETMELFPQSAGFGQQDAITADSAADDRYGAMPLGSLLHFCAVPAP